MNEFDYVVLGGGAGGSVVASRLSEDPSVSVCLLEAGGDGTGVLVRVPMGMALMVPHGINGWHYETVPQPGLNGRQGFQPRGKALGGSSAINAMVYSRGHASDYDNWASLGNPGWSYQDVLPYFIRSENNENFTDPRFHGVGGPLNVMHLRSPSRMNQVFLEACQLQGIPLNADYNGAQHHGCMPIQAMQKGGERCSASRAFIEPNLSRPNLRVMPGAHVQKLVIEQGRARGAMFKQGGTVQQVRARREVILAGGAFASPQWLMLSGIGPAEHLQAHGIPVLRDCPGVGQGLRDHISAKLLYRSPGNYDTIGISLVGVGRLLRAMWQWRTRKTGMLTSCVAESAAYFSTRPDAGFDDVSAQFIPAMAEDHGRKTAFGHGYALHITLSRPRSVGTVSLASADPHAAPLIDPKFFSHRYDMETLVRGVQIGLDILESAPFAPFRGKQVYPLERHNPQQIESVLRQIADTEYHPNGTCRMGPDSDRLAVVDARLRVKGIDGLRVADASIFPDITSNNTTAPTVMVGEKCADMVKADWR